MRRAAITTSALSLCLGLGLSLLTGCPDRGISKVDPAQGRVENKDIPVSINRKVDILFVIDDSPSMLDKQINLAKNFPNFIDVLSTIQGGLPDVHIAVVTSDLGTRGAKDGVAGTAIGTLGSGGCASSGKGGVMQIFEAPVTGGKFINDSLDPATNTRVVNYTGTLADAFSKMAAAGAGGCGFEQHLEAMKQALTLAQSPSSPNTGFLRDDAFLAVVIIADEDDCSVFDPALLAPAENTQLGPLQSFRCTQFGVICDDGGATTATMKQVGVKGRCHPNDQSAFLTKVGDYVTFLKGLKDDPNKVIVAGIIGPTTPFSTELRAPSKTAGPVPALAHSCTYIGGTPDKPEVQVADPPVRLKFFLDQFPNRSTFTTICQQDLSGGLSQIGDLLKAVIGDPCIEGKLADTDPNTAGDQFECSVSAVKNINKADQQETLLPACVDGQVIDTNTPPCWHLLPDADNCKGTPTQLTLKVENQNALGTDTHVVANCVTEVVNN